MDLTALVFQHLCTQHKKFHNGEKSGFKFGQDPKHCKTAVERKVALQKHNAFVTTLLWAVVVHHCLIAVLGVST